jgi:hypothetical protein
MKHRKLHFTEFNPYDLSSVAKYKVKAHVSDISALRSEDINSSGGKNSTVAVKVYGLKKSKQK